MATDEIEILHGSAMAEGMGGDVREGCAGGAHRMRLLTFNVQGGLDTRHYGHYLTGAWRHVMPFAQRRYNLDRIGEGISGYDCVALQEVDAGSLRTSSMNQVEYLARRAGYSHWGFTATRDFRPVAHLGLGYMSRWPVVDLQEHHLPSRLPGRRAATLTLGPTAGGLTLIVTHLSLGRADRERQLDFLSAKVRKDGPVVLLGDLNCDPAALRGHKSLRNSGLVIPECSPLTYPSWNPKRGIDLALASSHVRIERMHALPSLYSDHLPLMVEVSIPRV